MAPQRTGISVNVLVCRYTSLQFRHGRASTSTSTLCLSRAGTRCLHYNHGMLRTLRDARGFSMSLINGIHSAHCRATSQRICDSTRRRPPKQGRGVQVGGELGVAMAELDEMTNMVIYNESCGDFATTATFLASSTPTSRGRDVSRRRARDTI